MNDRSLIAFSILAGAFVGSLAGFLMFTDRGRRIRSEVKPRLDELADEVRHLQELAYRVKDTATESWKQVETFVDELGQQGRAGADEGRRH